MPIPYETLLDLAQQRLAHIAASPNFTRAAREQSLSLQRCAADELADFNAGRPQRRLVTASRTAGLSLCMKAAA